MVAGLLLAAGLSRRMGRPKLLLPLGGRAVVRYAAERLIAAGLRPVVVVTGPQQAGVADELAGLAVELVVNPKPEAGQARSLVTGIAALPSTVEAVVIALGDQPFVPGDLIPRLVAALAVSGKAIVAPRYLDGLGNPVLFRSSVFAELAQLTGDRGARAVIERDPDRVHVVEVAEPMPRDIDTPEDYERLRAAGENGA